MALILGTQGDDNFANSLFGTGSDDVLVGLQGNDFLFGSAGNDVLAGGSGLDVGIYDAPDFNAGIVVNNTSSTQNGVAAYTVETAIGTDLIDGIEAFNLGAGNDVAYLTATNIDGLGSYVFDGAGDDVIVVAETVDFAEFVFFAGAGNDNFTGGDGVDFIEYGLTDPVGTSGINAVFSGADSGTIIDPFGDTDVFASVGGVGGTEHNDTIAGLDGFQNLVGNGGADIIDGGADDDWLTGGAGADTFVIGLDVGNDTIFDFEDGIDQLDVSAYGLSVSQAVAGASAALSETGEGNLLIDFSAYGGSGIVELIGYSRADVSLDDFIL